MEQFEIEDIEELVKDEEPTPKRDTSSLTINKWAYQLAIVFIDGGTGWLIWQLTFWYYGVIWFLAGALAFFLHHKNYFTAGINDEQEKGALNGLIVSVVTMIIMAGIAGVLFIFSVQTLMIEAGLILVSLGLFFFHAYQLAMFVFKDDKFRMDNTIARAFAQAEKKEKLAKAGGVVVGAYKSANKELNKQNQKHGKKNVQGAMGKMTGQKPAYAQEVPTVELKDPTKPAPK